MKNSVFPTFIDTKRRQSSVGAFVASTNPTLTKFYSRVIYQRTTQELMDGLAISLRGFHHHRINLRNFINIFQMLYKNIIEIIIVYQIKVRIN